MIGSGSQHWTTGQNLAPFARAIVVTINYRLGVLGFLPTHDESAPSGTGGMNGIADQIAALNCSFFSIYRPG